MKPISQWICVILCALCVALLAFNSEDVDEDWEGGGPNVGVHSARGGQEC